MICNLPDLEIWMVENGFMEPHSDIAQAILGLTAHHTAEIEKRDRAIEKLINCDLYDRYGGEMSEELIATIAEAQSHLT